MDTQEILFKLEQVKEKEKDKQYFTGELNVYEMVSDVIDFIKEQERTIHSLDCELADIYYPRPYKFEELKKGMRVWDDGEKCCFKCNPAISTDMAQCVTYNAFWYNCGEDEDEFFEEYDEFEEGRYYPVTKALEYQE